MKTKLENNLLFIRADIGEFIIDSIKKACKSYNVKCAQISGIGATDSFVCGVYNINNKAYKEIKFEGQFEILSLSGNISQKDNETYVHAHICASDENGRSFGGHLIDARVSVTSEIILIVSDSLIVRKFDESLGINLMEF